MATKAPNPASDVSDDDRQRMMFRKAMSRKRRKEREAEGEIKELNIIAMMDMMTIILVFLLKSYASSSVSMTQSEDIRIPVSSTRVAPKDTVSVTITPKSILVGDKKKVDLSNATLNPKDLSGRTVVPLNEALKKEVEKLKFIAARNPNAPFTGELSVIGDKRIPYDLLLSVLYTAGQNELGNYRFIVVTKDQ